MTEGGSPPQPAPPPDVQRSKQHHPSSGRHSSSTRLTFSTLDSMSKRHPPDCPCLSRLAELADERARAHAREIQAMFEARAHGASLRQIGVAANISHEYARTLWNIRNEQEFPYTSAGGTRPLDPADIPADTVDGLVRAAQIEEIVRTVKLPPEIPHGSQEAIEAGCGCDSCTMSRSFHEATGLLPQAGLRF